jgi:DNA-binding MarR family transcriptional regulator
VERSLGEHEPPLTLAQYLALERLDRGEVDGTELAAGAAVSKSAVSQLVASLDGEGFLIRTETADRRRRVLRLSSEGKRVLRTARALLKKRLDPLVSQLPPPEADALGRTLDHLDELLSGTAPPRRRPKPPAPPHPPPHPRR